MEQDQAKSESAKPEIGRNEPCPCKSGKKYKRCCGVDAAPKLTAPSNPMAGMPGLGAAGGAGFPGFDPSQLDPAWLASFQQSMQRLPRGQLQKLQTLMQKAMSGKDVSREAADLERTLPPDFQQLMASFSMPGGMGVAPGAEDAAIPVDSQSMDAPSGEMSADEARRIVEAAMAEGKVSEDQAKTLLEAVPASGTPTEDSAKSGGISRLWKKVTGK